MAKRYEKEIKILDQDIIIDNIKYKSNTGLARYISGRVEMGTVAGDIIINGRKYRDGEKVYLMDTKPKVGE